MAKKDSAKIQAEQMLGQKLEEPMVRLRYAYAIDVLTAKLRLVNADLSEKMGRVVIRNMSSRIKSTDSIVKKLLRKKREVSFKSAVETLNDIAGIRAVCYFCDDIYRVADALRRQEDIKVIKEKDYIKAPKKSGYQSMHLIVSVPVTYLNIRDDIRVEVQIRSFAMDYWAELDNQMCYKKSAGKVDNVERETRNYSNVIAGVDNKMLELRKKIEKMQEESL